jgi:DNA-binding transcriptional LysR family regulator
VFTTFGFGMKINRPNRLKAREGRIDAALSAEEVPPALQSEIIFNLDFVCIVGSALPMRTHRFTLKQCLQLPHLLVETLAHQRTLVDRPLAQLGVKRSVLLTIPFFVPAIYANFHSDLVLTIPRKLAKITRGIMGVKVVEPPREAVVVVINSDRCAVFGTYCDGTGCGGSS